MKRMCVFGLCINVLEPENNSSEVFPLVTADARFDGVGNIITCDFHYSTLPT